jgi:hypothetical protein
MTMIRATAAALLVATAIAATTPVVRAQPEPAPSVVPVLPEIGRTRAATPACAVMRDIVIPAFTAAQRADARFGTVRAALPRYIQLKSDYNSQRAPIKSDGIMLESQYNRLSINAASLLQDAAAIQKLLDDPRIAGSNDPTIRDEREQLERIYVTQQARANALSQLVLHESTFLSSHLVGWEDPGAFATMGIKPSLDAPPRPAPKFTAPPGMPLLNGFDAADRARVDEWSAAMARVARTSEEQAAKTFLPLAQGCR